MTASEIEKHLANARQLQRGGRLNEAEALYRHVLAAGERDDVLAGLAQVAFQKGDAQTATDLLKRAVNFRPDHFEYLANLGMVLATRRQFDQAIEYLQRAVDLRPNSPEMLNNLGAALQQNGKLDEAIIAFRHAIAQRPEYAEAHYNLGVALWQQTQWQEAQTEFERAISLRQNYLPALMNLGAVLLKLNQAQPAEAAYRQALQINADDPEVWYGLGAALQQMKRWDEAIACYQRSLSLRPDFADAAYNLGKALTDSGRIDEAIASFRKSLELRADFTEASNCLAIALQQQERFDEALAVLQVAERVDPRNPFVHINLGALYEDVERFDEALAEQSKALELEPDSALAMWNKAMVLLATGQLKEGFEAYEARLRVKDLIPDPDLGRPKWDGSELNGRTIFLHFEQGYGDAIQFARYIPLLHARGGRVIAQCPRALHALFQGQLPIEQLLATSDPVPEFDVHCSFPSLPYRFGTTLQTIPAEVPYLRADQARVEMWKQRIEAEEEIRNTNTEIRNNVETQKGSNQNAESRISNFEFRASRPLRVGLAWAGNPAHRKDKHRSIPFSMLLPLLDLPNVRFFSLQKGSAGESTINPIANRKLQIANLTDFADTAALIANLDLVITVDTAVAHLAGAMARPTWLLLAIPTDWRWMLKRADTPWYPTMRLFRQSRRHDWATVIANVADELKKLTRDAHH